MSEASNNHENGNNTNNMLFAVNSEPKYVAQGLLKNWKEEKALDTSTSKIAPLEYYLRFNYEERYVKLCRRLGVEPCGFGAWLRKLISSIV